jgi:colanic acid/amylovoran biosynthesis glycosyltransferase
MLVDVMCVSFPALSETFVLDHLTGLIDRGHEVRVHARRPGAGQPTHPAVDAYGLRERAHYRSWPDDRRRQLAGAFGAAAGHPRRAGPVAARLARHVVDGHRASRRTDLQYDTAYLLATVRPWLRGPAGDLIHCHFGPVGRLGADIARLRGNRSPLVTTFHGSDLSRRLQQEPAGFYDRLFATGTAFLAVSDHWRRRLVDLGCPPERTLVHHMGVDCATLAFRPRHAAEGEPVRCLSVGRLVEKKGFADAVDAVARAAAAGVPVRYDIVGDGPLRATLQQRIDGHGAGGTIRLLGSRTRDEVADLLAGAHVFLAPSVTASDGDQEGIPVSIMEAMACGLPVLSTHHSGIPELVLDGETGFLVPERDPEALAARLATLAGSPAAWPTMGRAGRDHVERQYDVHRLNDRLVRLYEELLGRSSGADGPNTRRT